MKRILVYSLLILFTATIAFAHAGEIHSYMGTVTKINADGSFAIKTTKGKAIDVLTSKDTKYLHADNHAGKRSELAVGMKVVVKIAKDGKTAMQVKMTIPKKAAR